MKNISSQPSFDHSSGQTRPLGIVEKYEKDGNCQLRIQFSEIFRNPQIHYEAVLDVKNEDKDNPAKLSEIAGENLTQFI